MNHTPGETPAAAPDAQTPARGPRRILALSGSLRRQSVNRLLLQAAAEVAPPGLEVVVYDGLASIPVFNQDLEEGGAEQPAGVEKLRAALASSAGLLLSTPEYNQSIPGGLKNAIDWLSRPLGRRVLKGKPVALMGATPGMWGTRAAQSALRPVLEALGAELLNEPRLFVKESHLLFDAAGVLTDRPTRDRLAALLTAFEARIHLIEGIVAGA